MLDPWEGFEVGLRDDDEGPVDLKDDLCSECYNQARAGYVAEREFTWDVLPSYFGLPNWGILNAASTA